MNFGLFRCESHSDFRDRPAQSLVMHAVAGDSVIVRSGLVRGADFLLGRKCALASNSSVLSAIRTAGGIAKHAVTTYPIVLHAFQNVANQKSGSLLRSAVLTSAFCGLLACGPVELAGVAIGGLAIRRVFLRSGFRLAESCSSACTQLDEQ